MLLSRFDMLPYMDAVLVSSDVGIRKPDTRMYARICGTLRVPPSEAVYVADEQEDLSAAQQTGMFPVFIPGEDVSCPVGIHIEKVRDLEALLGTGLPSAQLA